MEYPCETRKIDQLLIGYKGIVCSLCDNCQSIDCSNPIEERDWTILGVKKKGWFYIRGDDPYFVVDCKGFIQEEIDAENNT
jgi:hypothetical protein